MTQSINMSDEWAIPELMNAWIALQTPGHWTNEGYPIYTKSDVEDFALAISRANKLIKELSDPWTRIDPADPGTLPEDYTLVIASTKGGKTADANYDHGKFYYDDGKEIRGVIAWQLWPEPYKE